MADRNRLLLVGLAFSQANAYVDRFHRHSPPVLGHRFSLGAVRRGKLVGVAIVSGPRAREWEDGRTVEVVRLCTVEGENTCSFLYGAAIRSAFVEATNDRVYTYTRADEPGTSCVAAGFTLDGRTRGRSWDTPSRRRDTRYEIIDRNRWVIWRPGVARPVSQQPELPLTECAS